MNHPPTVAPSVPDHELLRRIGRGSYGEVWLARNVMGSFRAIKVVSRASFDSDRPYEREFGGLQKFEPVSRTHPGFVSLLHIGRNAAAGYFYCVMEVADDLASGQSIEPESYRPRTLASELAKRGRLPLEESVELGVAMAAALGHLHSKGLVHRDIKPSNVIFVNGSPKLADIGLVTQIGTRATFVGTEGYLPPEGPGSPGADLYSLGKVLYEISMGKTPDQFPELPTRLRELPEAPGLMRLNAIVLKACEHQAARRFRSAEELQTALAQLRSDLARSLAGGRDSSAGERPAFGSKVIILSPSEAPADTTLARSLAERLGREGFAVFVDDQTTLSVAWARAIEQQIRGANAVIPILSPSSVHSELMAYALEITHQAGRRPTRLPLLVAVCLELPAPIPRHMALAIEGATLISADSTTDPEKTIGDALNALSAALAEESAVGMK